jgi:hypothetical protein
MVALLITTPLDHASRIEYALSSLDSSTVRCANSSLMLQIDPRLAPVIHVDAQHAEDRVTVSKRPRMPSAREVTVSASMVLIVDDAGSFTKH